MKQKAFLSCHPVPALLYFLLVLLPPMLSLHPLLLFASFLAALCCTLTLLGGAAVRSSARYLVPTALFAALVNLAFTHEGATILTYLPSGNPLTLESAAYGLASAALLATILLWCACWNAVMTSDKLMYLLGGLAPALSLVLSMTLRFIPRFRAQLREVTAARRALGLYSDSGSWLARLKSIAAVLSVMVTWSLESAAETAESMKSRGYGLPNRTAFSPFRLSARDKRLLALFLLCGAYLLFGFLRGGLRWRWYPTLRGALTPYTASLVLVYFLFSLTPAILQGKEARAWSSSVSKT